jgi:hypothetical protein
VNLCLPGKLLRSTVEGRAQAQNASSCNEFEIGTAVMRWLGQDRGNRECREGFGRKSASTSTSVRFREVLASFSTKTLERHVSYGFWQALA